MSARPIKEQIISELDNLTPDHQAHLLDIARRLEHSTLPPGAVDEMMKAIEEGCEKIDWSGWD